MMGQDDPTGGNPQDRINQLEQQAAKDKDALDKLLLAYQGQETEISDLKVQIEALNREIRDGIVDVESKETLLSNLRREKDDMEVQLAKANTRQRNYYPGRLQDSAQSLPWQRRSTRRTRLQ